MTTANDALLARWHTIWANRRAPDCRPLLDCYAQPHRRYHNAAHIAACFEQLDLARVSIGTPPMPLLELALFLHDAIYDPRAHDNELQSALLADRTFQDFLPPTDIQTIHRLIRVTDHKNPPAQPDEALIIDVDLSILGQPAPIFDAYEFAIRAEYAHVPDAQFRPGRAAILRQFLGRQFIYHTPFFGQRYEKPARANLTHSLAQLGA